jgi:hypothetical protein
MGLRCFAFGVICRGRFAAFGRRKEGILQGLKPPFFCAGVEARLKPWVT